MEATQVKTEEAVQAPGKKEPPKLKVPKKKKKWLKRLIIAVVVLAAIFLIFIRPMMSAGQQFVAGTYLPEIVDARFVVGVWVEKGALL